MTTLILAKTRSDARAYARTTGIRGQHAGSADQIRGLHLTRVIQLPSFEHRADRHAVMAEIRNSLRTRVRGVKIEVEGEWVKPTLPPADLTDELPGQMTIDDEYRTQMRIAGERAREEEQAREAAAMRAERHTETAAADVAPDAGTLASTTPGEAGPAGTLAESVAKDPEPAAVTITSGGDESPLAVASARPARKKPAKKTTTPTRPKPPPPGPVDEGDEPQVSLDVGREKPLDADWAALLDGMSS